MSSNLDTDRLAILVHEVRSPVAALSAIAGTLVDGELDNEARRELVRLSTLACRAIERIVAERKASPPPGSYVAGLLAKGEAAVCRKIGEEAVEVVTAALGGEGDRRVVEEVADLWFHTLVLLGERSIPVRDVLEELARRHAARPSSGG